MTQFTWRDVAAPDFSGAARGFTDAGRLLSETIGRAGDGVAAFDKSQNDLAAQKLALYVAQHPDVSTLRDGFNAGRLGDIDLTSHRMQAAALDQLNPTKLNAMLAAQQAQTEGQRAFDQHSALEEATPKLAAILEAHQNNNPDLANKLEGQVDWGKLGVKNMTEWLSKGPGLDRTAFEDNNVRADRADGDAATAAFTAIRGSSLNADDARLLLTDPKGPAAGLNVRARARLESQLSGQYPDLFGSGATGAGAAIAGAVGGTSATPGGGYDRIVGDVVQPPKPPSSMTISELEDYGNKVVIPATKAMDPQKRSQLGLSSTVGSSAMGKYQIIGDTAVAYAKKLGWDPKTTVFDAAHQEALAEAIFNDAKKGDLTDVFASVPRKAPGAYKDVSWNQMKSQIAQGESGPSTPQLIATSRDAQYQIGSRSMQDSAHGLDIDFGTTLSDNRSPAEVADALIGGNPATGEKPIFKGTSRAFMLKQITKIMREGNVNAATAAAVMSRNITGSDHDFWSADQFIRQVRGGTPNLGNGIRLNDDGVKNDVKILAKLDQKALLSQISARGVRNDLTGQIQAATAALAAAQTAYTQAATRSITQPGLKATLPRYEADLAARKQALMMLQAQTQLASNRPQ